VVPTEPDVEFALYSSLVTEVPNDAKKRASNIVSIFKRCFLVRFVDFRAL
jgi:hypothetical protein